MEYFSQQKQKEKWCYMVLYEMFLRYIETTAKQKGVYSVFFCSEM